jgi:hypothetical protein
MEVLAKVTAGDLYADLVNEGFSSGNIIECPQCKCSYRVHYKSDTSLEKSALVAPYLAGAVAKSHPDHPNRIRL